MEAHEPAGVIPPVPIAQRIPDCPQCGYSWEGLPAAGQCPECGLGFDEMSRQWKPPPPSLWHLLAPMLSALVVFGIQFVVMWYFSPGGIFPIASFGLVMSMIACVGIGVGFFFYWKHRSRLIPCACILTDELYVRRGLGKVGTRLIPWRDVRKVRINGRILIKSIAVHLQDSTQVDISGPFHSKGDLDDFVEAARLRIADNEERRA